MATINSLGRRKTSIARVILAEGKGTITVNGRDSKQYFPILLQQYKVQQPFALTETVGKYDVTATIDGGGITGQVEALRLGIARALVKIDAEHKPKLKALDLMTRDPREVERKKFGRKKARKRFQFSKR
ncbi:MAG: 30S ribosomal protein S9 [Flavobacteriales bacterium]|jgi:small subunit ribosomal protein S9|nr:30S ribosomal protein S9 [Flavobacteriales bacterium]